MTPLVRFQNVSKSYRLGEQRHTLREAVAALTNRVMFRAAKDARPVMWALRNVSFDLAPGEALGIIGPNGAGKTTILKLLSRITQPTSGQILTSGRVSALIELGAGFHPDLTGRENIYLNAAILGLSQRETAQRFDRIVAFSGLERYLDTPIKRYSSGMYVRLGFAVAAHIEPQILLIDEVLAVGDAVFRQKCVQRIHEMQRHGTSIVFVGHDLGTVSNVCETALMLAAGQVHAFGQTGTVIGAYEQYVRRQRLAGRKGSDSTTDDAPESDEVTITRVDIASGGKRGRQVFQYDDTATIRVGYVTREPVDCPVLHVRMMRSDGVACFTVRSNQVDARLDGVRLAGEGSFTLRLEPLQLYGGMYQIQAAIVDATDTQILAMGYSEWFEIAGPSHADHEQWGVFVPNSRWNLPASESSERTNGHIERGWAATAGIGRHSGF